MKNHKNLTLAAYDRIKEMMFNYDIIPGQRLVFMDLANQLGVSRTPVNNALSILAKEGYLDFIPHQGYSVHKLTPEEAEELFEMREILELGTISKAIRMMTPEKLQVVETRKTDYEQAITDRVQRELFVLDMEFHAGIIEMIANGFLVERYRDLCQRIFLRFRVEDLRIQRIKEIVVEHDQLLETLRIRDVAGATEFLKRHHRNSRENLFAVIFKNDRSQEKIKLPNP